jgi:hypothetical protein
MDTDEIRERLHRLEAGLERLGIELPRLIADLERELEVNASLTAALRARGQDIVRNRPAPPGLLDKLTSNEQDDEAFDGSLRMFHLRQALIWMDAPRPTLALEGDGADALYYLSTLEACVTLQRNRAMEALAALRERSQWLSEALACLAP